MAASGYWERFAGTRISRRRALAGAAGVGAGAVALGVVGCGGAGTTLGTIDDPDAIIFNWQTPDTTRQAADGGIHKSFSSTDITGTLDPFITPSFSTFAVAGVTYEPLLVANQGPGIEPRSSEGREIHGGLAESYEVSADASEYTLKLRPNAKFHDVPPISGRVMDMDDWRTSLERARTSSPLLRGPLNEQIDSITYPDSRTMVIKLKEPNVAFLRSLTSASASFYVLPKEFNQEPRLAETNNIGTNLRILDRVQPSIGREYRRHMDFWRGKPFIDRWHVPIIPEYAQQYAQFVTGNIIAFTPRQTDVLLLRNDAPNARMLKGDPPASYRTNFFGAREWETAPWRDDRVRKAMRMSVDWHAVRDQFDNRIEFEAAGLDIESRMPTHLKAGGNTYLYWLDPKGPDFGPNAKFLQYDVQEARQLMSAAGHPNGIELDGFMNAGSEYGLAVYPELVQITTDEWARSGLFRVRIQRIPYPEYLQRIYHEKDYRGVAVQQPDFTYNDVDSEIFNWYHSRGARLKFPSPIRDGQVDDFVMRQRREIDDNRRTQILYDFQRYMADKMYTFPGDGISGGFGFQQPWLMNTADAGHLHWIAADAPRRDQA
jgi:peptide/nickel transport system substrate-binding protein